MKADISTFKDIQYIVDTFYAEVREDTLIGPIFNRIIQDRWPEHLDKMYRFWQTVLLEEHTYGGSPFLPHARLPVEAEHFNRWKEIFNKTINQNYEGVKAEKAKWQADRMAEMFLHKIRYYRDNNATPLL